jgi:hypothetical protein
LSALFFVFKGKSKRISPETWVLLRLGRRFLVENKVQRRKPGVFVTFSGLKNTNKSAFTPKCLHSETTPKSQNPAKEAKA